MTNHQEIFDIIDNDTDFVTSLTQEIVQIPSVNPKFELNPELNKENAVQDVLQSVLEKDGFKTTRWAPDDLPERENMVADWQGSEEKSLILCGHVDVVPFGERNAWEKDPFSGELSDGKIWGRGAVDMKGGVACCIAAAHAIKQAGITLDGRLSIHTVVDEEAGGFGAIDVVKKGHLAKKAIIAEPTWGNIQPAEGGLSWVRVTLIGKSSHAGWRYNTIFPQPTSPDRLEPGVNAIELANRFMNALRDFEQQRCREHYHPLMPLGLSTINPGVIRGGVGVGDDGEPIILGNAAMLSDITTLLLDYKFMPNENIDDVMQEFNDFVHHFAQTDSWMRENPPTVEWHHGNLYFPPMDTSPDDPMVQSLYKNAKKVQQKPPKIEGFPAVTDAAHYAGGGVIPVIYGPSGDGFHGNNEYVNVDSLIETTKVIVATILDTCGVKE